MIKIRLKLILLLLFVFLVFMVGMLIFMKNDLYRVSIENRKDMLKKVLVSNLSDFSDKMIPALESEDIRVTLALPNGHTYYDSFVKEPFFIFYAEEVKNGYSIRMDNGKEYIYLAGKNEKMILRLGIEKKSRYFELILPEFYKWTLFGSLLILTIFFLFAGKVFQPLKELIQFTQKFGTGDYSARIHYFGKGEIEPVVKNLNTMARMIEENYSLLQKREETIETVILNLPVGVALLDERGKVEIYNPKLEVLLNNPVKVKKLYYETFFHSKIVESVKECYETEKEVGLKIPVVRVDREAIYNFQAFYISGKVILVLSDITESEKLNRLKEQFISDIVHEFKTPMAIILGYLEILEDQIDDKNKYYVEKTKNALSRLSEIINDLIRLEKIEYASVFGDKKETELTQIVDKVVEALQPAAEKKNIHLRFTKGNTIHLKAVEEILYYSIYNLIENSIKYNDKEKGKTEIRVFEEKEKAVITICDNGPGIAREYREDVFRRFFRVSKSRTGSVSGSGLGLSIVRESIRFHQGHVFCKDTPDETGICFEIRLPKNIQK